MENINCCTIKSVLPLFSIGVDTLGIKPRLLYLLGGLYSSCHYKLNQVDKVMETNITISQLSLLTGESPDYIKDVFYPTIKRNHQVVLNYKNYFDKVSAFRRNLFILKVPTKPFRLYHSSIFSDLLLTPEEKGYVMALYMLCVRGTRRYDLSNDTIAKSLGVSLNTWKKYKCILESKGVLKRAGELDVELYDPIHSGTTILLYPHVGTNTECALIPECLGSEIPYNYST